jgi:hypothetical protein
MEVMISNQHRKIPLTQGKFAIVDVCDYVYLMQWKWHYQKQRSSKGYAARTDRTSGQRTVRMHRVILEQMGYKNFTHSDHQNRNKLDNRRGNLRSATDSQNQHNQGTRRNNTSGYKGVCWHKRDKKWQARICVNGKYIYLGYYDDSKEAALAYNEAALKYHGEFAALNEV